VDTPSIPPESGGEPGEVNQFHQDDDPVVSRENLPPREPIQETIIMPDIAEFDNRMIQFWKSKCTSAQDRASWFERMISMYDADSWNDHRGQYFRHDDYPGLYEFMRETYSVEDSFERINDESRFIYPSTSRNFGQVKHAAIWRVAGYAGGLATDWYNPQIFAQVYENHPPPSPDDPDMDSQAQLLLRSEDPPHLGADNAVRYALSPRIDRTYTFGILSPARVYRDDDTQNYWLHVLHVWGVNFESNGTQDWARIVTPITNAAGIVDEDRLRQAYHARMVELFSIIKKAIIETVDTVTAKYPHITTVHVRIPGIGLNNYLNGFRRQPLKDLCILQFLIVMNDLLFSKTDAEILSSASEMTRQRLDGTAPIRLSLRFAEYSGLPAVANSNRAQLGGILGDMSPNSPRSFVREALFTYQDPAAGGSDYYLLVNAWDNMSFIGNGGSRDESLDGWIAGGYTYGRFASTVWLSNLHMIPSLVDHIIPVPDDS